ncbi:MAG TPA: peptidylprolyl isomerase [Geobacteraceae bacterium]|nr:peptidylprolyl isomerase [Geobacteraceae bacterium]
MLKRLFSLPVLFLLLFCGVAAAAGGEQAGKNPVVLMETSMGEVKIQLDPQKAPITVQNFLDYVKAGFYKGTIFHRVIPGFMIQGGGFTADMQEKRTRAPIKNEGDNGLKNERGTIAMARLPNPDSATAQFFINVVNNDGLNRPLPDGFGYAVFGRVISGMEVVDKIAKVKTVMRMGMQDVPENNVLIKSVRLLK